MPNDRMMVACSKCKETILLAKFWGGDSFGPINEEVQQFLIDHVKCKEDFNGVLEGHPFVLATEEEIDWVSTGEKSTSSEEQRYKAVLKEKP